MKENSTNLFNRFNLKLRPKLILVFLVENLLPIILLAALALLQIISLANGLSEIAVRDSTNALNKIATENIESLTTNTSIRIANFLYARDDDLRLLSGVPANDDFYKTYINSKTGRLIKQSNWVYTLEGSTDGKGLWAPEKPSVHPGYGKGGDYNNTENDDRNSWNYREPDGFEYENVPLYNEIVYFVINPDGTAFEKFRAVNNARKTNYPLRPADGQRGLMDLSSANEHGRFVNTYVKAESYPVNDFAALKALGPGEIYVSDVIGAYVGADYIGMYNKENISDTALARGMVSNKEDADAYAERIFANKDYEKQAYSGQENPNGRRFEGIVRFIMRHEDGGYVSLALNHDHIMEMTDHITPMNERYTEINSAFDGNYAFIWDYKGRSVVHPRHHSIVGYDPETGDPEIPWLEESIFADWLYDETYGWKGSARFDVSREELRNTQKINPDGSSERFYKGLPLPMTLSGETDGQSVDKPYFLTRADLNNQSSSIKGKWFEYVYGEVAASRIMEFDTVKNEINIKSRSLSPAMDLTRNSLVALDCRYLNNAPQCSGWMDLTEYGGSGSFYILWSGLYKLTTAAAIPYYTGQYHWDVQGSHRGFGFVTIGAGLEFFTQPASDTAIILMEARENAFGTTVLYFIFSSSALFVIVIFIAVFVASSITGNITGLINGISRFHKGERQFRFESAAKDEFGSLADSFNDMADSLAASVKNPLVIIDMERNIIYVNEYGLYLYKKTLEQVVGTPYGNLSIYPAGTGYDPIFALHEGLEANVYHIKGTDRYVKGSANFLYDKDGNKAGYIIETNDVTELEKAVIAANMANSHKGDFLARMSHEIRTPMNAVIGITNIVLHKLNNISERSGELDEIKDNVRRIEKSSQHLMGLLNDILDISKIEAGKIEISEEIFGMNILAETVYGIIKSRCDDKNITFKARIDNFDYTAFLGDPLRLRQVLINLLGNAVKFTPECGTIEFVIETICREAGKTLVKFTVSDTGIGISEDNIGKIFNPFMQENRNISARFGGSGLGLSISRNIVQLFGGDIAVHSEVDKGSAFSFEIWLTETENELKNDIYEGKATGKFKGKRLLLVDDVEINRMIVLSLLEDTGIEIEEADDGLSALSKFKNSPDNYFDIILMDIKMVHLDGYCAAAQIRELDRPDAKTTPIIALTANAFKEDIDEALRHGMNAHLSKPIEMNMLHKVLYKYLNIR